MKLQKEVSLCHGLLAIGMFLTFSGFIRCESHRKERQNKEGDLMNVSSFN